MAFEGFELSQVSVEDPAGEVSLRVRHGGSGPPLLLLHGHWSLLAQADYLACGSTPEVIHGMCDCYRAGATYDRALDWSDKKAGRKIEPPLRVLWGAKGAVGTWCDPLAVWREWASDVRGQAIDCGHFLPEEKPAETLAALREFFAEGR